MVARDLETCIADAKSLIKEAGQVKRKFNSVDAYYASMRRKRARQTYTKSFLHGLWSGFASIGEGMINLFRPGR